jgi:LL-diaminopimelate aminotransferase
MPPRSDRLNNLPPYVFSVIGDRLRELQAEGINVIRLDIGNPDMPPPAEVLDELATSAANPANHGYTGYRGDAGFRRAIADFYQERFDVSVHPDKEVLPLIGSKEGIVNLSLAYLGENDIALVPDVGYPSYSMGARLAGGEVHWIPMRAANGFLPDLTEVPSNILERARLLWVNYPNNPTGVVVDRSFYERLATFCVEKDILLVSDNAYIDVTYDDHLAPSALQTAAGRSHTVELFSFSKSYNMAGWRLGAAVGSEEAISDLLRVKSNIDSGHFKAVYDAGTKALSIPQTWIKARNAVYQQRRDRIMAALPRIGLSASVPGGALYVWAGVESGDMSQYVEDALTQAHVSIAPGLAYGPGGEQHVRISLGVPDDQLEIALERLESWYAKR